MNNGRVLWFTGLSGSGKTTISLKLREELENKGHSVSILDGDVLREEFEEKLGFSREDIKKNNERISQLARKHAESHDIVLVPIISPYQEDRKNARDVIGSNFMEVFINSSLNECIKRDVKGLYKKALGGQIDNFIGIAESNPYEIPLNPEIEVTTEGKEVEESVQDILKRLS